MITLTLGQLVAAKPALTKLLNTDLDCKISWKLRKVVSKIDSELSHHESERVRLVTKYGDKDNDGNTNVKNENI